MTAKAPNLGRGISLTVVFCPCSNVYTQRYIYAYLKIEKFGDS